MSSFQETSIQENINLEEKIRSDIEYYRNNINCLFMYLWRDFYYNKIIKLIHEYNTVSNKLLNFYYNEINKTNLKDIYTIYGTELIDLIHNSRSVLTPSTGEVNPILVSHSSDSIKIVIKNIIYKLNKRKDEYEKLYYHCAETLNVIEL